jgi:hypothetical protein
MKIKELKEMIKAAFVAEETNDQYFYEPMEEDLGQSDIESAITGKKLDLAKLQAATEKAMKGDSTDLTMLMARIFEADKAEEEKSLDALLADLMAEGLTEEKLDPETKEVLYPLEDLRTQAKESGDQKLETSLNNAITLVNKYMIMKVKDGKKLNLKALKAAIEKGDLEAFIKFQRNPYLVTDPYIAEDLYEAEEEEEVKVKVDAEEETTDGKKEKNDSIVVGKKIVSLSSLPVEKRDILDSLETLRAQAEEFGDQKFITQVGNTITFFTRDFVVDTPTKEQVGESLEMIRMRKIAGLLTEGEYAKALLKEEEASIADFLNANIEEFKRKVANPRSKFEIMGDEKVATAGPDSESGIDVSFDKAHMLKLFPKGDPYNEVKETEVAGRKVYYNNYL